MRQAQERSFKKYAANFFGYMGYIFCFLQWIWAALLYFSLVQSAILFVSPDVNAPVRQTPSFTPSLPDPVAIAVIAIVVIAMVSITLYALIKLPMTIAKNSNKIVHKTSQVAAPLVMKVQHKKDTKKNRYLLTPKIVIVVKAVLVVIPAVLTAFSGLIATLPIAYSVATIVGYGLAIFSVLFFGIQYASARAFRVMLSDLK